MQQLIAILLICRTIEITYDDLSMSISGAKKLSQSYVNSNRLFNYKLSTIQNDKSQMKLEALTRITPV